MSILCFVSLLNHPLLCWLSSINEIYLLIEEKSLYNEFISILIIVEAIVSTGKFNYNYIIWNIAFLWDLLGNVDRDMLKIFHCPVMLVLVAIS